MKHGSCNWRHVSIERNLSEVVSRSPGAAAWAESRVPSRERIPEKHGARGSVSCVPSEATGQGSSFPALKWAHPSLHNNTWWRLTATALSPRVKKMKLKVETLEQPDCPTTQTGCPEAARLQELPICSKKAVFRQLPPTVLGLHPLSWQLPKLHALTGFFPHRCSKSLFFTSYSTLIFSWPWVGTSHVSQANGSATHYTSMLTKGHFQTWFI